MRATDAGFESPVRNSRLGEHSDRGTEEEGTVPSVNEYLSQWRQQRRLSQLSQRSNPTPVLARRTSQAISSASSVDAGSRISEALAISTSLGWRLREEADLIRQQWKRIVVNTLILVYGTMFLLLNLAFLRFPVKDKRLKDLGHDWIPELPQGLRDSGLVDLPQNILFGTAAVLGVSLFINNSPVSGKRNPKPHLTNVVIRISTVYWIGHVLRSFTYLSTSPPGASDRCLAAGHPERYRPTFAECFYIAADVYHNCGDLLFSGHMLLCILLTLGLNRYGEAAFWISRQRNQVLVALGLLLCAAESYLIISSRHHYTADVVVAWYVTPLIWYYYDTVIAPHDCKPDLEAIASHVIISRHVEQAELQGTLDQPLLLRSQSA